MATFSIWTKNTCVCAHRGQISQDSLNNMTLLLLIFKYVSWGLAVGSLKLRVKTPGHKVPTLSTRETENFIGGEWHYKSENLPI